MASNPNANALPAISAATLRFFTRIVRSYFRRHFRAVLVQHAERFRDATGPLIVYANHASWWDPMVSVLLAQTLLPARKHYAPMDAVPLARYPILRKIGIFPVELATPRGAAQFLRISEAVLKSGGVLWVTPQGRFSDVRERPLAFKAGLAALVARVPEATVLPLAIEYTFWNERLPETLLHFAPAVIVDPGAPTEAVTRQLESALEAAMDTLREASMARDPLLFDVLLQGGRGTGGFYGLGRRVRALFGGKGFQEDHSARDAKSEAARR
ncbi:MAG: lysophospholipid acyltransferase family protein [Acidobacteriota bacterium]|nr:lysophospholipid acyltransferase family protein [Acidobacteriota bacterium]